jgi:DNA-binding transcriptional LysR family regulator
MNLETLKLFCDVVRSRSFSRGAALNAVSQSAASQAINQLEAEVGVQLIDRTRRPFILTAEGEVYYKGACEILENYESLMASVQAIRQEIRGVVRVSAIYSVGLHDMAQCVQTFMSQFPRAKVRLTYQRPAEIYEAVVNDEADLGIVSYPSASRELGIIPLGDEEMVLCCRMDHHLASRKEIPLRLLNGEDFVTFDRDLAIRKELDRCLREEQLAVRVVMEFDNIETIKQAILIGAGVSILPEPTVRKEVRKGTLAAIRLAGNRLTRPIGIIHRQRKAFTPVLSKFVEILTETKRGVPGPAQVVTKPVRSA